MQELIKLAKNKFIITFGDDFHNNNLQPGDYAYHRGIKSIVVVTEKLKESGSWLTADGISYDGYKLFKVTHSTEPIEPNTVVDCDEVFIFDKIKEIDLFEVKYLIGDVLNKDTKLELTQEWYEDPSRFDLTNEIIRVDGFLNGLDYGYNRCLEDNVDKRWTNNDLIEFAFKFNTLQKGGVFEGISELLNDFIISKQPKNKWLVDFDEDGNLILK